MLLVRRGSRIASQSGRTTQALRAIPSSRVYFSSTSLKADGGTVGHDLHRVTNESAALSEASEVGYGAEQLKTEASSAALDQQIAPDQRARPEHSGMTPLTGRPWPAAEEPSLVRKNVGSPITGQVYRFVRLYKLATDVTLADILESIAQTAPVGRVLHIEWQKKTLTHQDRQESESALVLLDTHAAAADLVRLAKQRTFLVRGKKVFAHIWRNSAFNTDFQREDASRVVYIRGPANLAGFNEEDMRKILMGNDRLIQTVGPLGLDAEACITSSLPGGEKSIIWRFYSQQRQARPIVSVLRQVFHKKLRIRVGRDPCWDEHLYPKDRENAKNSRRLPMSAKKEFSWPNVQVIDHIPSDKEPKNSFVRKVFSVSGRGPKQMPEEDRRIKHKENVQLVEKPKLAPTRNREQTLKEDGQPDHEEEIQLIKKLYGSPNAPLRLDEKQQERIAAWTQIDHLPKTSTKQNQEIDSPEQTNTAQSLSRGDPQTSSGSKLQASPDRHISFEQFFNEVVLPNSHKQGSGPSACSSRTHSQPDVDNISKGLASVDSKDHNAAPTKLSCQVLDQPPEPTAQAPEESDNAAKAAAETTRHRTIN